MGDLFACIETYFNFFWEMAVGKRSYFAETSDLDILIGLIPEAHCLVSII